MGIVVGCRSTGYFSRVGGTNLKVIFFQVIDTRNALINLPCYYITIR
jgi:hypothetical protein